MCWQFGEEIRVRRNIFNSGMVDDFLLNHNVFCAEPAYCETGGEEITRGRIIPGVGVDFSPKEFKDGNVILVLKGDDAHIEKFKKCFARSN